MNIEIKSDHIYRGKRTGKSNLIARQIYGAKFFNNKACFNSLIKLCISDIDPKGYDALIPVNVRNSKYKLTTSLCKEIAVNLGLSYLDSLQQHNSFCKPDVAGLSVLIFDDVIFTGKTMTTAITSCLLQKPKKITYFAISKSISFLKNSIKITL